MTAALLADNSYKFLTQIPIIPDLNFLQQTSTLNGFLKQKKHKQKIAFYHKNKDKK
jgi:hypothetical protein